MTLSPRQIEVMRLICHGQRDKEIASRLDISVHSVRKHAFAAIEKLRASNRENAVFIFTKRRLHRNF